MTAQEAIAFAESLNKHSFTPALWEQVKAMLASSNPTIRNTGTNILHAFPRHEMLRRYDKGRNRAFRYPFDPQFSDDEVRQFVENNTLKVFPATYWSNGNVNFPPYPVWE